ncbi:hypothetical protein FB45DRAFT_1034679 [Roridomyces roridus]|uniref:Uncharacterized protein n=1 Tax=Roridomyces roridus TaxID=1738132 RepID=A0AAD7BCV7_9AGAR|nr:hypothetical protein FB45DRAFT_1034679 [Roridomyces roridus]
MPYFSCPQIGCPFMTDNQDAFIQHLVSKQVPAPPPQRPDPYAPISPAATYSPNAMASDAAYYNPNFRNSRTPAQVLEKAYGPPGDEPRSSKPVKPVTQQQARGGTTGQ